jgi:hypothetical protein
MTPTDPSIMHPILLCLRHGRSSVVANCKHHIDLWVGGREGGKEGGREGNGVREGGREGG